MGHQVHFIRKLLGMTLQGFADRFCVTHPAVIGWEKCEAEATKMQWATEKDIRLALLAHLGDSQAFFAHYQKLVHVADGEPRPIALDVPRVAA